jgi:hypothetical protein
MPFVLVNLDGCIQVTVFDDVSDAKGMYESIRSEYDSCPTFEESEDGTEFSVEEAVGPCVKIGMAKHGKKDMKWWIR